MNKITGPIDLFVCENDMMLTVSRYKQVNDYLRLRSTGSNDEVDHALNTILNKSSMILWLLKSSKRLLITFHKYQTASFSFAKF